RFGFLVGQDHGKGQTRMIIDGDMQCFPAGELRASATSSVAAHDDLLKTGHAFDVEVQQVTGRGVFITHRGRSWMQIAPATQPGAPQDTAYGGGAQSRGLGNLVTRTMLPAQFEDGGSEGGRRTGRAMPRTRGAVQQASRTLDAISADPFGDRFRSDVEAGRGPLQRHPSHHLLHQRFSTTQSKSGILVNVHSTSPRSGLLSTISFSGSRRMDTLLKDHSYPVDPWLDGGRPTKACGGKASGPQTGPELQVFEGRRPRCPCQATHRESGGQARTP